MGCKQIFVNHVSDKGFISKILTPTIEKQVMIAMMMMMITVIN